MEFIDVGEFKKKYFDPKTFKNWFKTYQNKLTLFLNA